MLLPYSALRHISLFQESDIKEKSIGLNWSLILFSLVTFMYRSSNVLSLFANIFESASFSNVYLKQVSFSRFLFFWYNLKNWCERDFVQCVRSTAAARPFSLYLLLPKMESVGAQLISELPFSIIFSSQGRELAHISSVPLPVTFSNM